MVGRPREFDENQVLDAAMQAFWARGYEATSLSDLMKATGLHKGSLYQAFGDKHSLFIQSLKRYLAEMHRQETAIMKEVDSPLEGLRAVAHAMIDLTDDSDECPKGCMAINTLIELAPHDEAIHEVMMEHIATKRSTIVAALRAAQEAGEMSRGHAPEMVTELLMTFMMGLAAGARGALTKAEAHDLVDAQLSILT